MLFDGKSVITGVPLSCVGGRYTTFCNDGSNDLSSANLVCTLYGYYGESVVTLFNLPSVHPYCKLIFFVVN